MNKQPKQSILTPELNNKRGCGNLDLIGSGCRAVASFALGADPWATGKILRIDDNSLFTAKRILERFGQRGPSPQIKAMRI